MALRGLHKPTQPTVSEKEQMLNLNQRLETYLTRVKLLDEENAKLLQEIQARRRTHHQDRERRTVYDEELRNARLEVDAMWKERVYAEVEVVRLNEELQGLDLQLQRETQAQAEARGKAEQSRRELEEERRAQVWLKEKVKQLEQEMKSLIQSRQEEVAHVETLLLQHRVSPVRRPTVAQNCPDLLELGQEYHQRAARAWEEAARTYQDQLTRLEDAVTQTRQRLVQANQERGESVTRLQNLDRELLGLQDLRESLESKVDQQRESHCQDVHMLQEHLEDLERERQALTQKMDHLLQENRGLAQMKMSLSLEVATYRALLDNESFTDVSVQKSPRNIYSKDAVFSPWGAKHNYQMSPRSKSISMSSVRSVTEKTKPPAVTSTPVLYQKYTPRKDMLEISKRKENVEDKRATPQLELTPYPKVLSDGAVEDFRPQAVHETVTHAEPLSPPDEQRSLGTAERDKDGDSMNDAVNRPSEERPCPESKVCIQSGPSLYSEVPLDETSKKYVEPVFSEESPSLSMQSEQLETQTVKDNSEDSKVTGVERECTVKPFTEDPYPLTVDTQEIPFENTEIDKPQSPRDAWIEAQSVTKTETPRTDSTLGQEVTSVHHKEGVFSESCPELEDEPVVDEFAVAVKSGQDKVPSEHAPAEKPHEPLAAWTETAEATKNKQEQLESSELETEAFLEPNFDTKSSSPLSENSMKNQLSDFVKEELSFENVGGSGDDVSPPREKLYDDGEEMDTWDSVMDQNKDVKAEDVEGAGEVTRQHAEPEEDISVREAQQQELKDVSQNVEVDAKIVPQPEQGGRSTLTEKDLPDKNQDDEEDSQNVSISWQTELEGDSYALDNTIADTRPLIRYKSDDTDGNTQASHIDNVDDSTESEQDKKVGEMESGAWNEETHRFGTMEDLCEEAEGDVLDEEYDPEHLTKDLEDGEHDNTQENDDDSQEEETKTVVDEELDTDKLVEQELENLTTECFTTHFAHHQASTKESLEQERLTEQPKSWSEALQDSEETLDMEDFHIGEAQLEKKGDELVKVPEPEDAALAQVGQRCDEFVEVPVSDKEKDVALVQVETNINDRTEGMCEVSGELVLSLPNQEVSIDHASIEQKEHLEEQLEALQDLAETTDGRDFPKSQAQVEEKSNELVEPSKPEKERDEGTERIQKEITDVREEHVRTLSQELSFDQVFGGQKKQDMEEQLAEKQLLDQDLLATPQGQSIVDYSNDDLNQPDETSFTYPVTHPDDGEEIRDTTPEDSFVPEEEGSTQYTQVSSTTAWEVKNAIEDTDSDGNKITSMAQKGLSSNDNVDDDSLSPTEEPLNSSPKSAQEETDLFIVKESKSLLKTNGKANLDDLFGYGGDNDFWGSPLEAGATNKPDDVGQKRTEWKLGFGDVENMESDDVPLTSNMAFEQKEVTKIKSVVKGEIVHSEESEDDSEAMSSGEE